jgi:hypothetical protein
MTSVAVVRARRQKGRTRTVCLRRAGTNAERALKVGDDIRLSARRRMTVERPRRSIPPRRTELQHMQGRGVERDSPAPETEELSEPPPLRDYEPNVPDRDREYDGHEVSEHADHDAVQGHVGGWRRCLRVPIVTVIGPACHPGGRRTCSVTRLPFAHVSTINVELESVDV